MKIKRFQEGGAAPAAPAESGAQGGGPEEQIMQMAQQIVQQLGPEAAALLAQTIVDMLQGGGAETPQQGAPVYAKKGGKLVLVNRK